MPVGLVYDWFSGSNLNPIQYNVVIPANLSCLIHWYDTVMILTRTRELEQTKLPLPCHSLSFSISTQSVVRFLRFDVVFFLSSCIITDYYSFVNSRLGTWSCPFIHSFYSIIPFFLFFYLPLLQATPFFLALSCWVATTLKALQFSRCFFGPSQAYS